MILSASGRLALLRLHLVAGGGEELRYALADGDRLVFASADAAAAAAAYEQATRRAHDVDEDAAGTGRRDYLETQPSRLPALRGAAFDKLRKQLQDRLQERR